MRTARRSLGVSVCVPAGVLVGLLALSAPSATAQPQSQAPASTLLRPPSSNGKTDDKSPKYRMYLTVVVIGGLLIGANAIPSKRGHQD